MTNSIDVNNCTEKQFEKWYWKDYNDKCKECEKSCKQSWKVMLLSCNSFVENLV